MNRIPTKYDDIIDSRDVIARIEALTAQFLELTSATSANFYADKDNTAASAEIAAISRELDTLEKLAAQGQRGAADWEYGESLVRDSYFKRHAQELASELGLINDELAWPHNCIDWDEAARNLQLDYVTLDFDGVTYWTR